MSRLYITRDLLTTRDKNYANCLNYLYYQKEFNEKSKTTRWSCTKSDCFSSITTNMEDEIIKIKDRKLLEDASEQLKSSHEQSLNNY